MERQQPNGLAGVGIGVLAQLEQQKMAGDNRGSGQKRRGKVGLAFDPIAAALRQMHEDVASEAIPDDFMRLLDQIEALDTGKRKSGE